MTTANPTVNNDQLLSDLMHLVESYDELHSLVPDGMCHNLLGYINQDFKRVLPDVMRAIVDAEPNEPVKLSAANC